MYKVKEFLKELSETTTITKREFLLTALVCAFGGMVLGMLCSPRKKTMIGSHNGNNTGSNNCWDEDLWEDEMWEDDLWDEDLPDEVISFK